MNANLPPVIVGYDGSSDSDRAVGWAAAQAASTGALLHVLVVAHEGWAAASRVPGWDSEIVDEITERAHQRLKHVGAQHSEVEVRRGPAAATLIEASHEASLVVLGTRGHTQMGGALVGSVSQHVARHATCPVVVVRPSNAVDSQRVVVGVDGSEGSRAALEFACDYAEAHHLSLTVLYGFASRGPLGATPRTYFAPTAPPEPFRQLVDSAERVVAESIAGIATSRPDLVVEAEAVAVPPARALVDASLSAALVVVGSHGRGVFAGLLLGSVSQAVLHDAHCPVAVVR